LLLCAAFLSGTGAVIFWFLYFSLYWQYRDLFNEIGRYYDEQDWVMYYEQDSVLIFPALAFSAFALLFIFSWWVRRRALLNQRCA
jgi:cell division protein FtsX